MKLLSKVAIFGLAMLLAGNAYAKDGKKSKYRFGKSGTMTLTGSAGFQQMDTAAVAEGETADGDPTTMSTFSIMPRFGYFVMGSSAISVEVGVNFGFNSSSTSVGDTDGGSTSGFMIGLDPTLYFNALRKRGLYPFVHASFGYQSQTLKADPNADEVDLSGTDIRAGAGLALAVGKKQGGLFKLNLDYVVGNKLLNEDENGFENSGLDVNVSFGLFF